MLDGLKRTARGLPDRWPWLGFVLAVQRRFSELNGGYVASAVTLALFLSLFPLLLVGFAVLGFFSASRADLADDVIRQLGLTGEAAKTMKDAIGTAEDSRQAASVVGLVGLLWAGLGVVAALQYSINTAWQVKGRGLRDKLYGLAWLGGAGVILAASFTAIGLLSAFPGPAIVPAFAAGIGVYTLLFWWTFRVLGSRDVGWRPLLPGALAAGVGFEVLTLVGAVYVPRAVASSSALYGSIGVVFAILAWLFFFGRLIVYASVVNILRFERERGTVTAEIEVPRFDDSVALEANRAGAISEVAPTHPARFARDRSQLNSRQRQPSGAR